MSEKHSAEKDAGEVLVNNWRVTWFGRFWLAKVLCWHGTKNLRILEASNGGEIYCARCGMKRVGWMYDPKETRVIPPAPTTESDDGGMG